MDPQEINIETNPTARHPDVDAAYQQDRAEKLALNGGTIPCPLCEELNERTVIENCGTMVVVKNDYPYASFQGVVVVEHLMLSPMRHVSSFSEFSEQESKDYWQVYGKYSEAGFSTYTRAKNGPYLTVRGHVHTHLFR